MDPRAAATSAKAISDGAVVGETGTGGPTVISGTSSSGGGRRRVGGGVAIDALAASRPASRVVVGGEAARGGATGITGPRTAC